MRATATQHLCPWIIKTSFIQPFLGSSGIIPINTRFLEFVAQPWWARFKHIFVSMRWIQCIWINSVDVRNAANSRRPSFDHQHIPFWILSKTGCNDCSCRTTLNDISQWVAWFLTLLKEKDYHLPPTTIKSYSNFWASNSSSGCWNSKAPLIAWMPTDRASNVCTFASISGADMRRVVISVHQSVL